MGQLDKKEIVYKQPMVGTPTSYTQAQSLDGRLVQKNISSTAKEIIPQQDKSTKDFKSKFKEFNTKKTHTFKSISKELKR
ncbi:hypothetical protein [uncultured Helicobacter sp.]|uniref:hypothetical protein n=1 Tax=uncultured Helicobacter sp. TaxID=175537 RepID=UPI002605A8AC|nr:hypothetical protein [uncultured Helicobacter sp.]